MEKCLWTEPFRFIKEAEVLTRSSYSYYPYNYYQETVKEHFSKKKKIGGVCF